MTHRLPHSLMPHKDATVHSTRSHCRHSVPGVKAVVLRVSSIARKGAKLSSQAALSLHQADLPAGPTNDRRFPLGGALQQVWGQLSSSIG